MGNSASEPAASAAMGSTISQDTTGNQNQTLGNMSGGTAIANAGNVTINQADPDAIKRIVRDELRVANQRPLTPALCPTCCQFETQPSLTTF